MADQVKTAVTSDEIAQHLTPQCLAELMAQFMGQRGPLVQMESFRNLVGYIDMLARTPFQTALGHLRTFETGTTGWRNAWAVAHAMGEFAAYIELLRQEVERIYAQAQQQAEPQQSAQQEQAMVH